LALYRISSTFPLNFFFIQLMNLFLLIYLLLKTLQSLLVLYLSFFSVTFQLLWNNCNFLLIFCYLHLSLTILYLTTFFKNPLLLCFLSRLTCFILAKFCPRTLVCVLLVYRCSFMVIRCLPTFYAEGSLVDSFLSSFVHAIFQSFVFVLCTIRPLACIRLGPIPLFRALFLSISFRSSFVTRMHL
jgi:hypothetical protein